MNLQQIFDKSVSHMLTQGRKSSDGTNSRYRSDKGSCGIGCFIPDSRYKRLFDDVTDNNVSSLIAKSTDFRAALKSGGIDVVGTRTLKLLNALQHLHDRAIEGRFMMDIKRGAYQIAKEFGLTYESENA